MVGDMSELADAVLPLIRTRADLSRWAAANEHGRQMHEAAAILRSSAETAEPRDVLAVTQKAIASALKVIMRADDSSGIIGDVCRDLLDLHPKAAARAKPPVTKLIDWMIAFQFDNDCDFFTLDPVAYADALGPDGVAAYRARLGEIEERQGPRPSEQDRWASAARAEWFTLDWNAKRLAVLDRDVEAIIRTHARDRTVAAWLQDAAVALVEIGAFDLALDWARQAVELGTGYQSLRAGDYWCELLAKHRPAELLAARLDVFRRWPSASTAGKLYREAGHKWPQYQDEVSQRLAQSPPDAVQFALRSLDDPQVAWELAHSLALDDDATWGSVAEAYESVDPIAVLPVLGRLVRRELTDAGAEHYRRAARTLKKMRTLAAGTDHAAEVDELIDDLRAANSRRPRLQQEFDRARLPQATH